MIAQARIEEFLKTSMSYMKNKNQTADDGEGELRIGKPMKLGLDMYSLLFTTFIRSEYIYVIRKQHKEDELDEDEKDWIKKLRRLFQKQGPISDETARKLLSEKQALEAKADEIIR